MPEIILPRPDNVKGKFGAYVTSDVYDIAGRLQEVSPRLFVQLLDPPVAGFGVMYNFAITEYDKDSDTEYLVYRVEELDARVIEHVQYLRRVPVMKRLAEAEKIEAAWKAECQEAELEKLVEEVGGPMYVQLERCGFIAPRGESFPKRGPTARRSRAYRERAAEAGV